MIPLGRCDGDNNVRIVVGHNVGFDRAYVADAYDAKVCYGSGTFAHAFAQLDNTRYWDTMSMHIAYCGMSSEQQKTFQSKERVIDQMREQQHIINKGAGNVTVAKQLMDRLRRDLPLYDASSANGLIDSHRFHCGATTDISHSKDDRKIFETGSLMDVYNNFQVTRHFLHIHLLL
jgi:DNA polymerase gamma 1